MPVDFTVQPGTPTQQELLAAQQAATAAYNTNLSWRMVNAPETLTPQESQLAYQYNAQRDAASEQAKMVAAFSQPRNDLQVERSQSFQDITAQYAAQQNRVVTGGGVSYQGVARSSINPYPENSAAGIAWVVGRTGGAVEAGLARTALSEGTRPSEVYVAGTGAYGQRINVTASDILAGNTTAIYGIETGRETVPIRDLSSGMSAPVRFAGPDLTTDVYMPYGRGQQQVIRDAKVTLAYDTGELGVYQVPTGHSYYMLVGGGGRAAAQSGMFTVGRPGTTDPTKVFEQWQAGSAEALPRSYFEKYSGLGAEAYGGRAGVPLDSRTLTPSSQMSVFNDVFNIATYVNPVGANLGKGEATGANIPWTMERGGPAIQYMNERGLMGTGINAPALPGYLSGGKTVGGAATFEPRESVVSTVMRPSDIDLWAMGANLPFGLSGAIVGVSDFVFGGRTMETTTRGSPTFTSSTVPGEISKSYREVPGGVEVTTISSYVTERGSSVPITIVSTPLPSGFAFGEQRFAESVSKAYLPEINLPRTGLSADYNIALVEGMYAGVREKPLTAAVNVGVGVLLAAGGEAIAGVGAATVVATRGTSLALPAVGMNIFATKVAPVALGTLYAADVVGRSTQWGKDFSTESTRKLGEITSTEIVPMAVGGGLFAYRGPISEGAMAASRDIYASGRSAASGAFEKVSSFDPLHYADIARTEIVGNVPTFRQYKENPLAPEVMGRSVEFNIGPEYKEGSIYDFGEPGTMVEYGRTGSTKTLEYFPAEKGIVATAMEDIVSRQSNIFKPSTYEKYLFPKESAAGRYTTAGDTFAGSPLSGVAWRERIASNVAERVASARQNIVDIRGIGDKYTGSAALQRRLSEGSISIREAPRQFRKDATTAIGSYVSDLTAKFTERSVMGGKSRAWDIKSPLGAEGKATVTERIPGTNIYRIKHVKEGGGTPERINYGGSGGIGGTGGAPRGERGISSGNVFLQGLGSESKFAEAFSKVDATGMTLQHLAPSRRVRMREFEDVEYYRKTIPGMERPAKESISEPLREIMTARSNAQIIATLPSVATIPSVRVGTAQERERSVITDRLSELMRVPASVSLSAKVSAAREILDIERGVESFRIPIVDIITMPARESVTRTRQEQITRPVIETVVVPFAEVVPRTVYTRETRYTEDYTRDRITEIIKTPELFIPPGGVGGFGGGGNWPTYTERTRKRQYRNPVVDIEYLTSLSGSYGKRGKDIISQFKR